MNPIILFNDFCVYCLNSCGDFAVNFFSVNLRRKSWIHCLHFYIFDWLFICL